MDDFDDLLAGLDAGDDFRAERFGFDALDEIARDLEIHVGFEQRHAHFAQGVAGVALGNFSEAAQISKGVLKFCCLTNRTFFYFTAEARQRGEKSFRVQGLRLEVLTLNPERGTLNLSMGNFCG